ncbi:DUF4758 domain-containing protein [Trichonephila clavipes]|nr:DUF4758 domain-containing protein [Trichonephila clavipes]
MISGAHRLLLWEKHPSPWSKGEVWGVNGTSCNCIYSNQEHSRINDTDPQATWSPTSVTTISLTELSHLNKGPEGILIQGPFRASYASDWNEEKVIQKIQVPLRADGAAPVYIPTAPRAEALTAAEEIDADISLPTVTVRGFLNFKTTVDGTVIVFTPASGAPQDPTPASTTPSPASSAPPGTPISPRNDDIQHLTYTGDDRNTRTELENEAHTPEDDRQNFRQRHLKLGYSDLGTTPHSPKNEEPQQNLHKPDATPQLPQYPTGLVTVLGGTHVKDGATTVFETKVIGTYIEGKYAQILQSTSQIIFAAKSEDLSTPKPSPTKPSFQKSATLAVTSSRPTPSKSNQILVEHSSSRQKPTGEPKEYRSTTPDRELWTVGRLVDRANQDWTTDRKALVRCPMPPNTLRVHTEYVLVKSVGPKVLWAESRVQETGEYFLPLQFPAKIVEVEIGGVAIYRPFGKLSRANSHCHLYGAQGLGQRQTYFYPLATVDFMDLIQTTSDSDYDICKLDKTHGTKEVPYPKAVAVYNDVMGGVDHFDQRKERY